MNKAVAAGVVDTSHHSGCRFSGDELLQGLTEP